MVHIKFKRIYKSILIVFLCLIFFTINSQNKEYKNPVIAGFNPDPSVCRVGDDYYLVTSTFEYFPGVPIYHSKDLVNWKMIGHVLNRPEQLDLDDVASTAGIYAPTIRYHKGVFYMITTLVPKWKEPLNKPSGNFIVTATNPAGPWSNPHWIEGAPGIDPSLFFDDDGKVYYCGNRPVKNSPYTAEEQIWIQEIDLKTFTLKGEIGLLESRPYYEKRTIGSPYAFEAPHIYKKDGIYYLLIAHGGTGMWHSVSIWKSTSPLGPWQENPKNPILTHLGNDASGIHATGHADIFKTQDGEWWSLFLAVRSNDERKNVMGRETFLAPVDWSGEWPIYNPEGEIGKTAFTHKAPKLFKGQQNHFNFKDDFENNILGLDWSTIRTPRSNWWDLKSKPGKLKLQLRPEQIEDYKQPSFLGVRVPEMKMEASVLLDFKPKEVNECAGLVFERGHDEEWSIIKEISNGKLVISVYYDGKNLLGQEALKNNKPVRLKIQLNDFKMQFFVEVKANSWTKIAETDASSLGFPPAGRFTGSMVGLYASSRGKQSSNWAIYDDFKMEVFN